MPRLTRRRARIGSGNSPSNGDFSNAAAAAGLPSTSRATAMTYLQRSILETKPLYVPHMVFLDRRGIIRADYPGESDFFKDPATNIRAELEKLLKPAAK